ncbi:Flp family type IVb pilin [Primorskyibacter sp. S187A]|uniref:Flp family type IVb pilin n=1 Tax=Primorskyibacter sp. S187A TaxID=3415130 RepID=UPI003C7D9537
MIKFIKNFRKDEDGAVTVDWVVLTAAVVGMAIAAYSAIETSANGLITAAGTAVTGENDFGGGATE